MNLERYGNGGGLEYVMFDEAIVFHGWRNSVQIIGMHFIA